MDRKAELAMLVLSIRTNVRQANQVLEELNRGAREQTYPRSLERAFRAIEHDARALNLERLADVVRSAKEASTNVLRDAALADLLGRACGEFAQAADDVEKGIPHQLDRTLATQLEAAARGDPSTIPS